MTCMHDLLCASLESGSPEFAETLSKAGSSNEADRTPELRAFRVRLFSPCKIPGTLHQRREKSFELPSSDIKTRTLALCLSVAPSKAIFMSRLKLPWHSAFRIWQRIKGLSRLSRTWTMALCLSVAPSKGDLHESFELDSYLERPGLFGSGKGCTKGYASKYRCTRSFISLLELARLPRRVLCFSWIERTENEISINYLGDDGSKRRSLHEEGRSSLMFESLHASVTVVRHLM